MNYKTIKVAGIEGMSKAANAIELLTVSLRSESSQLPTIQDVAFVTC